MRPRQTPIGLKLNRTARVVGRAFDDALAEAGGSLPVWLVLLGLKTRQIANQRELAEAVGIRESTLTNHLNEMEDNGLINRRRHPENRRIHLVELTAIGEEAFLRLRNAAIAFDRRLRTGLTEEDVTQLADLLDRLRDNVGKPNDQTTPRPGPTGTPPDAAGRKPNKVRPRKEIT
jgi:MarR family transcriptional regulator for hemolysin